MNHQEFVESQIVLLTKVCDRIVANTVRYHRYHCLEETCYGRDTKCELDFVQKFLNKFEELGAGKHTFTWADFQDAGTSLDELARKRAERNYQMQWLFGFICKPCQEKQHGMCKGDTHCDCQHRVKDK